MDTRRHARWGLLLVAFLTAGPSADAGNCFRAFATIGGGATQDKLRIDPNGAANAGAEIARFWRSDNSTVNNFGGSCPSQNADQPGGGWWQVTQSTLRGVGGILGVPGCSGPCFTGEMTIVIEEHGAVAGESYFIALRVDETAGAIRWWDFSRTDPSPSPSVVSMQHFPTPDVTASTLGAVTLVFPDVAQSVHAVRDVGGTDTPLPASSVVSSYDLYRAIGPDPGREATDWALVLQRPYTDGPAEVTVPFECPPSGADIHFALGLSFDGGVGPEVPSVLVGRPVTAECSSFYPPVGSGAVPDGRFVAGTPLSVAKAGADALTLAWDASCLADDDDYAIYEGPLGLFTIYQPMTCTTDGLRNYTFVPSPGDRYYLVVPQSRFEPAMTLSEGSYGRRSDGSERLQNAATACRYQSGSCPP